MDNPYSSPQVASEIDTADFARLNPERERLALLGEVFVAWEWLRLWYNGILAVVGILYLLIRQPFGLLLALAGAEDIILAFLGANACFTVGPLLEGYVTWWYGPVSWLRKAIFIIGTLGAIVLTVGTLNYILTMHFFDIIPPQS